MKAGFYPKLALDGLRKNRRMVLPYLLTCIGMVMMYYIIVFLQQSETIFSMRGGRTICSMLGFGSGVIAVFAAIFLFYTNSFLMRRRKKEFGLYNILGMGKRNIGRILFWESLILALISLVTGLTLGVVLSKLAELGLVNIMQGDVRYQLSVSLSGILLTARTFGVIFVLLFLNALRQVRFSSAIALLRSENTGEKPPRANWLLGLLGLVLLIAAYVLAVTIKHPLAALEIFFIAVLMVVVGTYLLMCAGSVLLCRVLQKKKNYYYKPNHFVSVSSMAYRMKRNGAGLASICILATMVLVMISSTASLYFGSENAIHNRYPREINMEITLRSADLFSDEKVEAIHSDVLSIAQQHGVTPRNAYQYRCLSLGGLLEGTTVETDSSKANVMQTLTGVWQIFFVPLSDYNRTMGESETLSKDEVLVYTSKNTYLADTISFKRGNTFRVKKHVKEFVGSGESAMSVLSSMVIVVSDFDAALWGLAPQAAYSPRWAFYFDTGADEQTQIALNSALRMSFQNDAVAERHGIMVFSCEGREAEREDFYAVFGGLFYLGILLSLVFILAAVLIIYYKQISEGYEDQARFEIMQKVGMTAREIRKSINSQLLTVFFLPLVFAALHLCFAFPMIRMLLALFGLNNAGLFALTTAVSALVFALFYTLVYRITSNAYYNIVSSAQKGER